MADVGDDRPYRVPARLLALRLRRRARRGHHPLHRCRNNCPGDDDLENVLGAAELVEALDSTFRIVEGCLDRWTLESLEEEIRRPDFGPDWVHLRGAVIQRVFTHDVWHVAQLNEVLGPAGLPLIDLWD